MSPRWLYWPAAAAAWAPSDLTNLVGWWKADAISGLSNSDPVSTWADSSGAHSPGWDATASGGARPTYITNAQNSLPIVRFSGSNHLSLGSLNLFRDVGGGTIYTVLKNDALNARGDVFYATTGLTPIPNARLLLWSGGVGADTDNYAATGRRLDSDSSAGTSSTATITSSWTLLGSVADWTNSELTLYVDAVQDGQNTSFHSGGNTSNTANTHVANSVACGIGASNTSGSNGYDGDIAEIVVVHEALSTSDREKLEGYLAWKWGLEGNLPGGGTPHPYKNSPP